MGETQARTTAHIYAAMCKINSLFCAAEDTPITLAASLKEKSLSDSEVTEDINILNNLDLKSP